jgi:hypothetical protein
MSSLTVLALLSSLKKQNVLFEGFTGRLDQAFRALTTMPGNPLPETTQSTNPWQVWRGSFHSALGRPQFASVTVVSRCQLAFRRIDSARL